METAFLYAQPIATVIAAVIVTITRSRVQRIIMDASMKVDMRFLNNAMRWIWAGAVVSTVFTVLLSGWAWVGMVIALTGIGAYFNAIREFADKYKVAEISSAAWLILVWLAWLVLSILLIADIIRVWIFQ